MQIYVGKNGQQLGPFSLEEINRKLADGSFAGTDLAWYEGAVGWAPLSSVAGVVIPPPPAGAAPVTPTPTPTPAPTAAPVAAPLRSNVPIVQPSATPGKPYKTMARIGWILLGVTLVISFIPILGCGSWVLVWPVAVAAIILGIVVMSRGATGHGIALIIAAIVLVPVALVAPIVSTALLGGADLAKETQIVANLRAIDTAKNQYVVEKNPSTGAPVTMASLTSYLGAKEIKPIVGEQYDPRPVGEEPTATLPAGTKLGNFKGGEVLTAARIEKDMANGAFSWYSKKTTTLPSGGTSPTPTPTAAPASSPLVSPKPSAAPSVTASPNPSTSPRSSSAPHSLISPRQSVEPEDSPSSGPSPSAKFGPRTSPRRSPAPSDEKSGGLKQGRQYPRESPGASPEKSPADDDDDN